MIKDKDYYNGKIKGMDIVNQITNGYSGVTAFYVGNIIKYLIRAPFKNQFREDLIKMADYANRLVENLGDDDE